MREVVADAPGRVNLIGDHTDYQEGFVLSCAVPHRTSVTLRVRRDQIVHLESEDIPEPLEYMLGSETPGLGWADYVQGLTMAVAREGARISGFDLRVRSTVPRGCGLSSSAALEVAVLRALRAAFDLTLGDIDVARLGQCAEVEFVGVPVGITDQMAASLGAERQALFLDTRTLVFNRIPLPYALDLVVIDSGVGYDRGDAGGGGEGRRPCDQTPGGRTCRGAARRALPARSHARGSAAAGRVTRPAGAPGAPCHQRERPRPRGVRGAARRRPAAAWPPVGGVACVDAR